MTLAVDRNVWTGRLHVEEIFVSITEKVNGGRLLVR